MKLKFTLFFLLILICNLPVAADKYVVKAENGLNIRETPSSYGQVIDKLNCNAVINVKSIEDGWAKISWNGEDAYISSQYIARAQSSNESSGGFKKWLFSFDGSFLSIVKWFFIIAIGLALLKFAFSVFLVGTGFGLLFGGLALGICYLLKLIGLMGMDTAWDVAVFFFYGGWLVGIIYAILHPSEIMIDSVSSGGGSGSDLERYEVQLGSETYYLTQTYTTSACWFTDQYGDSWEKTSSGTFIKN